MFRIRMHGRGGQGVKTASRILGSALFVSGYEVQDAPRYGAERRGAPMFAYVRADRHPILERGIVVTPDLVLVADDTLVSMPAAGVLAGIAPATVLVVAGTTSAATWRQRLQLGNPIHRLARIEHPRADHIPEVSARLAGAGARLLGLEQSALEDGLRQEIAPLGRATLETNLDAARDAFAELAGAAGSVRESTGVPATDFVAPEWITLDADRAAIAAPNIHAGATSIQVRTGLWRTLRPVLDEGQCRKCVWVCGSACPDGVIATGPTGFPAIDFDHCKGCLICMVQCPRDAFSAIPEAEAQRLAEMGATPETRTEEGTS